MIKENLNGYIDGQPADENDIATVTGYIDGTVIFKDDDKNIFFLIADSSAFEIGTVERKQSLTPLEKADEPLKKKILEAVQKEGK